MQSLDVIGKYLLHSNITQESGMIKLEALKIKLESFSVFQKK